MGGVRRPAQQLVAKAQKDAGKNSHHSSEDALQRIRRAIDSKGRVTVVEADWLVERLRALLHW